MSYSESSYLLFTYNPLDSKELSVFLHILRRKQLSLHKRTAICKTFCKNR